ncbi:50S ribosomal protein L11 methyltransferase [Litoribrevibacter albus]|uniref:Ribosomal protein L11 methyltransferase n=1 Tax=Litoribrevibacter albus TaxID=1473156 RepID=A0AA37S7L2_9GAMM|nr:50S ribosomal protein L11 methyltransferase [Litoribrevibacter albus]GLQ29723.1 ribosomal protein L11 methyltransferase [Litoribrevibacter albus]
MSWLQIKITTQAESAEQLEDYLLELGASSITLEDPEDQPIYEPQPGQTPLWKSTRVVGLFTEDFDIDAVAKAVNDFADTNSIPHQIQTETVEDQDWERAWMDDFKPIQCGQRLWVCPSWLEPPKPDDINLILDPGLAFGTGTHPTTFLCLEYLDSLDLTDLHVLDYGCGSGILAIAALLLGAKDAIGVDIDPQALIATEMNLERNGLPKEKVTLYLPDQFEGCQSDITVANILAGPLVELAPAIAGNTKPGGHLALSGILQEQAQEVFDTYSEYFDLNPIKQKEDWILITGQKK